jgi:hypothetical protein
MKAKPADRSKLPKGIGNLMDQIERTAMTLAQRGPFTEKEADSLLDLVRRSLGSLQFHFEQFQTTDEKLVRAWEENTRLEQGFSQELFEVRERAKDAYERGLEASQDD